MTSQNSFIRAIYLVLDEVIFSQLVIAATLLFSFCFDF